MPMQPMCLLQGGINYTRISSTSPTATCTNQSLCDTIADMWSYHMWCWSAIVSWCTGKLL